MMTPLQIAASRIQGLTRQVNHWKGRTIELEAALGSEKAARISAEATRDRAFNAGAANVELQEELQKERSDHQETCRYLADAQAKVRELLSERDGLFARLRQSIAHGDFAGIALAEAHAAIWGLGCEMTNLRCDLATARDERLRAEIADLRSTFDVVHFALGIKSGDNIIQAIDKLVRERNCAKEEWERAEEMCKGLVKDIEVLRIELRESQKEAVTARQDAVTRAEEDRVRITELSKGVKVGDYVEVFQATDATWTRADEVGIKGTVQCIDMTGRMVCLRNNGAYALRDVRKVKLDPKPGDMVRLVRVPTENEYPEWCDEWGIVGSIQRVRRINKDTADVDLYEWPSMGSDKIQRLAVAIKGLERKITDASNEIDRKYPHVRGTCCQSCYYGSGGYTEAVAKQDRRMEWLRELKQKMVKATGYEPKSKMKCAKCGGGMGLEFVSDSPTMGIAYNVYSCDDCLTICREDVWKNAGKTWITGDGTISRGNETICPLVEMVRIEDLSSGEWIRQGRPMARKQRQKQNPISDEMEARINSAIGRKQAEAAREQQSEIDAMDREIQAMKGDKQ